MSEFNFKSQVCTDKNQSKRLLALGLKKETADCHWCNASVKGKNYQDDWQLGAHPYCNVLQVWDNYAKDSCWELIPAWSLHRIMSMLPRCVDGGYHLVMSYDHIAYRTTYNDVTTWWRGGGNLYDMIIETIEWLIKEGCFNKEYLV